MKATIWIDIVLCLLGIIIYFINRYANRSRKAKPSLAFWLNDNWPELVTTLALNVALMIIIHLPGTTVSLDRVLAALPFDLTVSGIPTLCFFLGLGLTASFYRLFKQKAK